ncbi:MAG: hypothetical protein KDJ36_05775 [Hyphomicrobiaceae bacterium]|nr:hypothetical protein [Hyphomicrobiaceae bacterium]
MTDVGLGLEEPRNEALKDIIYAFIVKCLVSKGRIPHSLKKIDSILMGCMVSEEILKVLVIKFLNETSDTVKQIGVAKVSVDWAQHALELQAGKTTIVIDKEDPLGSMSPAMSELANNIRIRGIKQQVNNITWSVTWIDRIYASEAVWDALNAKHGLVRNTKSSGKYAVAEAEFSRAKKKKITAAIGDAREVGFEVLWLDD